MIKGKAEKPKYQNMKKKKKTENTTKRETTEKIKWGNYKAGTTIMGKGNIE